jgi:hypothetical protein
MRILLTTLLLGLTLSLSAQTYWVEKYPETGVYVACYDTIYLRSQLNDQGTPIVYKCLKWEDADHFDKKEDAVRLVNLFIEQRERYTVVAWIRSRD